MLWPVECLLADTERWINSRPSSKDVLSGKGRMVTLVGEPGIGKTRTAQELATYAGMRGADRCSGDAATSQLVHLLTGRGFRRYGVTRGCNGTTGTT